MAAPDDIAKLLPEPPPPNPSRREAAIEVAMRRFDGGSTASPASAGAPRAKTTPWWTYLTRPQAGILAAATLTALIGIPVALISIGQWPGTVSEEGPTGSAGNAIYSDFAGRDPKVEVPPKPAGEPPPAAVAPKPEAPSESIAARDDDPIARQDAQGMAMPAAPSPPKMAQADAAPPPPPPPALGALSEKSVAGRSAAGAAPPAAAARQRSAPAESRKELAESDTSDDEDSAVVISGSRRVSSAPGRGDWNACTVNDPRQSLRGCRTLVTVEAKGAAGKAAARLAEGLSQAWRGDFRGAIAAFNDAIEANPRYAFAYLNRGLAYQRIGDTNRALADLNLAVRYAPGAARGYYNRGQLLRQQGNERRARSDEQRAIELDSGYAQALK